MSKFLRDIVGGNKKIEDVSALKAEINSRKQEGQGKSLSITLPIILEPDSPPKPARVKLSNSESWTRWLLGLDPNRADMIGEFIASKMAYAAMQSPGGNPPVAPEVSLIPDGKGATVLVSYYVDRVQEGSLRDVYDKRVSKDQPGNMVMSASQDPAKEGIEENPNRLKSLSIAGDLKREMYAEIARRMILGDHDHNPGNSLIVKDKEGREHIAGIDYGHAFNDLIKRFNPFSSAQSPKGGGILDSLNRSSINGFGSGAKNKLHRDYEGVFPDPDFAEALRNTAAPEKLEAMHEAADKAVQEIAALQDSGTSKKEIKKIVKTLCARMGHKIDEKAMQDKSVDGYVAVLTSASKNFVTKNAEEAKSVANMIDVQVEVDKALKADKAIDKEAIINNPKIMELYEQDKLYLKGGVSSKIKWPKTDKDKKPFEGSLSEYVEHRAACLKQDKEQVKSRVGGFAGLYSKIMENLSIVAQKVDKFFIKLYDKVLSNISSAKETEQKSAPKQVPQAELIEQTAIKQNEVTPNEKPKTKVRASSKLSSIDRQRSSTFWRDKTVTQNNNVGSEALSRH